MVGLPVLNGKHKDFGVHWYQDVGVKIVGAVFIYSLSPIIARLIGEPLMYFAIRCYDRKYMWHLRKVSNLKEYKKKHVT